MDSVEAAVSHMGNSSENSSIIQSSMLEVSKTAQKVQEVIEKTNHILAE